MRSSGAFVLGAIVAAAAMWLWGPEMKAYVEEKTCEEAIRPAPAARKA